MADKKPYELALAAGFDIFPLAKGSKRPLVKWEEFRGRKPTEDEIKSWGDFENYAIVCGEVSSGLVVLDFERWNDFVAFFPEWEELAKTTWVIRTAHGGAHVYYIAPEQGLTRSVRIFGVEHPVDLLGEGGYVVGPGSVIDHSLCDKGKCELNGITKYEFVNEDHPPEPSIATDSIEVAIKKRAAEIGWSFGASQPQAPTRQHALFKDMNEKDVMQLAKAYSKYWVPGLRNDFVIDLCGGLIARGFVENTAQNILKQVMKLKNDYRPDVPEKVHYQYERRARRQHLSGFASLYRLMRKVGGGDIEKDIALLEAIAGPLPQEEKEEWYDRRQTIIDIADEIMEKHTFLFMRDSKELMVKENGIYAGDGEVIIREELELVFPGLIDYMKNNVISRIRDIHWATHEIFNAPPELLPVKNGVLNLITGQLRPYNDKDYFIFQLPVEYDPHADCPMWKKFISEVVHPQDAATLQEWAGYNLWRGLPAQKAMLLLGSGSNGKSTFLEVLISVLGRKNVSNIPLQRLTSFSDRFASSELYGKLANIYSDLPDIALKNTGLFKVISGKDQLTSEEKFQKPFNFTNTAKLTFSANEVPSTPDTSNALYRRWIIINFP
ncbi:MAG: phage/plasmid primase, P4 family, partial [Conexivisphaerales archaeon]